MKRVVIKDYKSLQKKNNKKIPEYDSPWKNVLDAYFEDFIAFCWPQKYLQIDWSKGYKSLDKELIKVSRNVPTSNRIADKLMEICLKDGEAAYILLHIEVQKNKKPDFEERMFIYRLRLRDLYRKPVASLAILIDNDKYWRPGIYREVLFDSSVEMHFPVIKLIDYRDRISELENSRNRFAAVILAQLAALEKQTTEAQLITKVNLIRWLYRRGWKKDDVLMLLSFIDWVLVLPDELEAECDKAIETLEEEERVQYVTHWERRGIQRGIQKGGSSLLLQQLEYKFKTVPDFYRQKIETASKETLLAWGLRILDSQKLEEVFEA